MQEEGHDPGATEAMLNAIGELPGGEQITALELLEKVEDIEALKRVEKMSAVDWINAGDEVIDLLKSFENWNDDVVDALESIHEGVYRKLVEEGNEEYIGDFTRRWNGWVGEAAMRRAYDHFQESMHNRGVELQDLETGLDWDKNGVDGALTLQIGDEYYFIYLQAKVTQSERNELSLKSPEDMRGKMREKSRGRMLRGGDIYKFCRRDTEKAALHIRKQLADAPEFDSEKFRAYSLPIVVDIRMNPTHGDGEPPNGWANFMRVMQRTDLATIFENNLSLQTQKALSQAKEVRLEPAHV